MEIRKLHTGIPGLMVRTLAAIVLPDMGAYTFTDAKQQGLWTNIAKENEWEKHLQKVVREMLVVGDGAFKLTFDLAISVYPIVEWYSGERVEMVEERGRLKEMVFKTPYTVNGKSYTLCEHYGYGYITNHLYCGEREVSLDALGMEISDWAFDKALTLGIPMMIFENTKFEGRGGSIFDGKADSFDALDEAWSQWMDALRAGRAKTYIPENLIPRDPKTGALLPMNAFDNRFIATGNDMGEGVTNKIVTEQPVIPHDSYLASYVTALDLCLQGVVSPGTLGIDVKKLDNAEAQREKEKATLYTRNAIVAALQDTLPKFVSACINGYYVSLGQQMQTVEVDIPFGEYANPSFESQVETVAKGKQGGIMSIEASVEELYGTSRDEVWKKEEVLRLKTEQGIAEMEEPAVGMEGLTMDSLAMGGDPPEAVEALSLNGAQIGSLLKIVESYKNGQLSRSAAISIVTSALGISRENAESFIEEQMAGGMEHDSKGRKQAIPNGQPGI